MASRCIAFVHAHPDDEALSTGGTIARYADEGAHVVLITCTNGEVGEIAEVPELGSIEEIKPRLGEVRRDELVAACKHLGDIDLRMLGYHDSGMEGTPENDAPHAFMNTDLAEVTSKVEEIFREVRPDVVVTYNEYGAYGHPDHIRAHEAAVAASRAVGVKKLYYTAFPRSLMLAGREVWGDDGFSEEDIDRIGTPDEEITTVIDTMAYVKRKIDALKEHRTQLGTIAPFLEIPEEIQAFALGAEHYVLIEPKNSGNPGATKEDDLFAGL